MAEMSPDARPPSQAQPTAELQSERYVAQFFEQRFSALYPSDQAWVVANMSLRIEGSFQPGQVHDRYRELKEQPSEVLKATFSRMLASDLGKSLAPTFLLDVYSKYHGALLAALAGFHRGDEIGLLTARGSRSGNEPLLDRLSDFFGFEVHRERRSNAYFVNDPRLSDRISHLTTSADRKVQIVIDFARGFLFQADGTELRLEHPNGELGYSVVVYEDEAANLAALKDPAAVRRVLLAENSRYKRGLSSSQIEDEVWQVLSRTAVVDVVQLDHRGLFQECCALASRGMFTPEMRQEILANQAIGRAQRIHLCDVDGTLVTAKAQTRIINVVRGELVAVMSQEEGAQRTEAEWQEHFASQFPGSLASDYAFDFSSYIRRELVAEQAASSTLLLRPNYEQLRAESTAVHAPHDSEGA